MAGFIEGVYRGQSTLFPALLDDYVAEENPVRAVDVFVDGLDLDRLGFVGVQPLDTGRPGYHPGTMLKLYIYGYLNRVPSSRRLERECQRNIEMIWLTGQLAPDFKTIADFRKDNGKAIREVCREFVALCRKLDLLSAASVAIDGSKFKAVNARDKNFTEAKMKRRLERIDESIARYLSQLETADRHGDAVPEETGCHRGNDVLQVADAPGEAIDAGDHQNIAGVQKLQDSAKRLAALGRGAGDPVLLPSTRNNPLCSFGPKSCGKSCRNRSGRTSSVGANGRRYLSH
jgi:transposase